MFEGMSIYIRTTKNILGYFIIALVFITLPLAFILDKLDIKNFNYRWLYLLAVVILLLFSLLRIITENAYFRLYKYPKLFKLYDELTKDNLNLAIQKYPSIQYLKKDRALWEETVEKQGEYQSKLNLIAKEKVVNEFGLSEVDWNRFQIQFMRNKKHGVNLG
ncbi:MAG: hypothetical protein ACD_37C00046G0001 [uncultured bacterium]|nr:MAG: hypothetical protein ACD_37C00046G0001 [uncultured bacterium]